MGYSFRLAARVLLYASSHRQDDTYHSLCYTSRGSPAGTRNSSMGPPHEGSIRRPIAPWANALTTELHLTPEWTMGWCFTTELHQTPVLVWYITQSPLMGPDPMLPTRRASTGPLTGLHLGAVEYKSAYWVMASWSMGSCSTTRISESSSVTASLLSARSLKWVLNKQ